MRRPSPSIATARPREPSSRSARAYAIAASRRRRAPSPDASKCRDNDAPCKAVAAQRQYCMAERLRPSLCAARASHASSAATARKACVHPADCARVSASSRAPKGRPPNARRCRSIVCWSTLALRPFGACQRSQRLSDAFDAETAQLVGELLAEPQAALIVAIDAAHPGAFAGDAVGGDHALLVHVEAQHRAVKDRRNPHRARGSVVVDFERSRLDRQRILADLARL